MFIKTSKDLMVETLDSCVLIWIFVFSLYSKLLCFYYIQIIVFFLLIYTGDILQD